MAKLMRLGKRIESGNSIYFVRRESSSKKFRGNTFSAGFICASPVNDASNLIHGIVKKDFFPIIIRLLLLICFCLWVFPAHAHPYASGIAVSSGTVTFYLNENADDVKVIFDNGSVTNDLGALSKGQSSFMLNLHTNYSIVVAKVGSGTVSQISSDSNPLLNFFSPRGVTINKNPRSPYFGRMYIANSSAGNSSTNYGAAARTTGDGLFMLNPDASDALGAGTNAATAGVNWGTGGISAPFLMTIGPDDKLYITDSSVAGAATWVADPNVTNATLVLAGIGAVACTGNTNGIHGRPTTSPIVTGSLATSNLTFYVVDADLHAPASYSIYQYSIGAGPLPWTTLPLMLGTAGISNFCNTSTIITSDLQLGPNGFFYTAEDRSSQDGNDGVKVYGPDGTTFKFGSSQASGGIDPFLTTVAIAISPDGQFIANLRLNNSFLVTPLTNGVPDLSRIVTNNLGPFTVNGRDLTWDTADNLWVSSSGQMLVRGYSMGFTTTAITSNDTTGTNGSFSLAAIPVIGGQPQSQVVPTNLTANFKVAVAGPGVGYQWRFRGTNLTDNGHIAGSQTFSLSVSNVQVADAGSYQVVITNGFGSVTSAVATLTPQVTVQVSNTNDSGPGSLRQSVTNFIPLTATSIIFATNVTGTIGFTSGELAITHNVTITGPGAKNLTISGNNSSRIFNIGDPSMPGLPSVAISGVTIANGANGAPHVNYGYGGGIMNSGSLVLNACVIRNCHVSGSPLTGVYGDFGGGIANLGPGSLTMNNCTVSSNTVNAAIDSGIQFGFGGGIYNAGTMVAINCTFNGNSAFGSTGGPASGGAIQSSAGTLALTNCTISGNFAAASGTGAGAVANGGGVNVAGGTLALKANIIAGNSATVNGSVDSGVAHTEDVAYAGSGINNSGLNLIGVVDGGVSWGTNDLTGTLAVPLNPVLGLLQDNGGPTPTMALLTNSPAIDAGNSAGITNDQRGYLRPIISTGIVNGGDGSDIGALELGGQPIITLQPLSQAVTNGANVFFRVTTLSNSAIFSYQWTFNGTNLSDGGRISGANNLFLAINGAQTNDSGNYQLIITNATFGGISSAVAALNVYPFVSFIQQPASVQITNGGTATFSAVIVGLSPFFYQWMFNGSPIAGATNSSFSVVNAQSTNAGTYTARASDSSFVATGTQTSAPADLVVVSPSPQANAAPVFTNLFGVHTGLNLIANQFNHGGNTLNEIMPAVPDGSVVSKFNNGLGTWTVSQYSAALGAWNPANIVLSPGDGAFFQSPSNFTLNFTGNPNVPTLPPLIPNGVVYLLSRQTNEIGTYENTVGIPPPVGASVFKWNVTNQNFDQFTYNGSNWSGGPEPTAAVGESMFFSTGGATNPPPVPARPVITAQPTNTSVAQGATVVFSVAATGAAPLSYQWQINGNPITGATGSSFAITNVQPSDGGNYTVAVFNSIASITSASAALSLSSVPVFQLADNLADAVIIGTGTNGVGQGSTVNFTTEPGEPSPYSIPGGASALALVTFPSNGIVTVSTAGSGFDTLLGIYTFTDGNTNDRNVTNLTAVAADDDGGPNLTSFLRYNAVAGTTYVIQVEGFYAEDLNLVAQGNVVLSWSELVTSDHVPVILTIPKGQSVPTGSNVTLAVTIQPGPPANYQWFFGEQPLLSATNSTLVISNVSISNVGSYKVQITDAQSLLSVTTVDVGVEIFDPGAGQPGDPSQVHPENKFRSATDLTVIPGDPYDPTFAGGFSGTQIFNNTGQTAEPTEPDHCGYTPSHSTWYSYKPPSDGLLTVISSNTFNGVLSVYTGPGDSFANLVPVACSGNHGAAGEKVTFAVSSGTQFWVVFDGINGATGPFSVSYNLVQPPVFTKFPLSQTVTNGGAATLTAGVSGAPALGYQWMFNGTIISGATTTALVVNNLHAANQGGYALMASNIYGTNVTPAAVVYVGSFPWLTNFTLSGNSASMQVLGITNATYILQYSSDLTNWFPLLTNNSALGIMNFTDPTGVGQARRFYRARTP